MPRPANFTRQSENFVDKFRREHHYHLIPLYYLLRLSDFAREGMEHSGSYRFADHMYRGVPSGRGLLGRWLDALLLGLPASRSMRHRCFESRNAMLRAFRQHIRSEDGEPFRVLTIPCGLPRDVRDFADRLAGEDPDLVSHIDYTGMDIDPGVVEEAARFLANSAIPEPTFQVGDALNFEDFPRSQPQFIASTGLGEFLDDPELAKFYDHVFDCLAPGGIFFTSAAACGRGSEKLLRAFELNVRYRTKTELDPLLRGKPWKSVRYTRDAIGLQTFVLAVKGTVPASFGF